jgi:seryl-tRNA synthetase
MEPHSSMPTTDPSAAEAQELRRENERLRARLQGLEAELVEVQERANAAVAKWQERAYWLDRWHLDLNALMRKPGAAQFRAGVRAARAVVWALKRARRRMQAS